MEPIRSPCAEGMDIGVFLQQNQLRGLSTKKGLVQLLVRVWGSGLGFWCRFGSLSGWFRVGDSVALQLQMWVPVQFALFGIPPGLESPPFRCFPRYPTSWT